MYTIPKEISELFDDFHFVENMPILKGSIPSIITQELEQFTNVCRNIKDSESSVLLRHRTPATTNYYNLTVPIRYFESSPTHAYLNYLGEYVNFKLNNEIFSRQFRVRKNEGHFDAYDFWINFYNSGDYIEPHGHAGKLSGIIFFSDVDNQDSTKFKYNNETYSHAGKKGEVLIFPAVLQHWTEPLKSTREKISFSFNLISSSVNDE